MHESNAIDIIIALILNDINPLGRIAFALLLEPRGPSQPPARHVQPEATVAYGAYLANSAGNCVTCQRSMASVCFRCAPTITWINRC